MTEPLPISVILPVRNGARFITDALRSIASEPVRELIVVDDCSSDDTVKVFERFVEHGFVESTIKDITLHQFKEQKGVGAARNYALKKASCSWLAFIDADDVWMPGKTLKQWNALQVAAFQKTTGAKAVSSLFAASLVDHFMDIGYEIPETLRADKLGIIELFFPSNLICHRSVFERVGGFDPDLFCANDVDWYHRAMKLGLEKVTVQEVLVRKRVHDSNLSLCQGHDMQRQIFASLKRKVEPNMFPVW